ncbi:metallophosphoesterase [Thioalkalivibrio sp. AKL10]|uniref:metallophosphoesterase family protein n=1 Tax=Thioalkalivibrio sp. AKL10 TaxID=1158158 RepID=UPI00036D4346|nr:metallophosphoesterase [Thioalkalivibrio sp. AKL10]
MKIVFVGDPHGRVPNIIAEIEEHHIDAHAVCMVGDFDLQAPLDHYIEHLAIPLLYIPGNHDYDSVEYHDHLLTSRIGTNIDGQVIHTGGLTIAGLGGHFVGRIWRPPDPPRHPSKASYAAGLNTVRKSGTPPNWRNDMPLRSAAAIWPEDLERLAGQTADVLVTHEAPTTHYHGFAELDRLAQQMGVRLIVHGHHHEHYNKTLGDIRVIGLGAAQVHGEVF